MESQRPNVREDGAIWHLPDMRKDRSEAVLEMEISKFIPLDGNGNDREDIRWCVYFPLSSEPPEAKGSSEDVFSLPSEPSAVIVVTERHPEPEDPEGQAEFEYEGITKASLMDLQMIDERASQNIEYEGITKASLMDLQMIDERGSQNIELSSGSKHRLTEQEHSPGKDLDLLTDVILSMKANCSGSNRGFILPDNEKQHTPPRNTVLHLAASAIESRFERLSMAMDLEMQREKTLFGPSSSLKNELMEQEHGPNKDPNLVTAACVSKNANVSCSGRDVISRDDVIYMQRTPLSNTVLHLAATCENEEMVDKVAQHAPRLFTATNNNYDTALHVAARAGHGSTIRHLLNSFLDFVRRETKGHSHQSILEMLFMVSLTLFRNRQGNTFLHEAFMTSTDNGAIIFQAFEDPFIEDDPQFEANFKGIVNDLAPFAINEKGKSLLYLAIKAGCEQVVDKLMDICIQRGLKPQGKSLLLPAFKTRRIDMLENILRKRPNWIHLRNEEGRFPLHDAASMGYLDGVTHLKKVCASCTMERDGKGFLPIHLACSGGHIEVVQELLKCRLDPKEMLDNNGRNLLHVATQNGKYAVVEYILQQTELEFMINQKDNDGNTPLHLASIHWHPKIVHALTWDSRVVLGLQNKRNLTALDMVNVFQDPNPSLAQRLTWNALKSAGTPQNHARLRSRGKKVNAKKEAPNTEQYKGRVDTLIVVSTLIITASFAAGFTVPGDVDQGVPVMLNQYMFHLFILFLTISLYCAIGSTVILMWARLEDLSLAILALKFAMPLLGVSLTTLSVAFLAGIYLIVNKLSWLTTTFLVISVVLILKVVLLYFLLLLPSSSSKPFFRYISYYPFLLLAKIAKRKVDTKHKDPTSSTSCWKMQTQVMS